MTTQQTESEFMQDLFSFLDEEETNDLGITPGEFEQEGFRITSMEQANYFARKLNEIRAEKDKAQATADQQLKAQEERIKKWLTNVTKPLTNQEERLLSLLREYATEALEGSSKKSIKLIEGTLQFKKQQPKFEYEDQTLLTYLQLNSPSYVKTTINTATDKAGLKKAIEIRDGLAYLDKKEVQGISVQVLPDAFDMK